MIPHKFDLILWQRYTLNDVRVFTQKTWPQPIIVSDKSNSQLFIHYYMEATDFWGTDAIKYGWQV